MSDIPYRQCLGCYRPLRKGRARAKDHPGTVQYCSDGRCSGCAKALRQGRGTAIKQPRTDVNVTATLQSLTAYLEWRRPYRAKAGAQ